MIKEKIKSFVNEHKEEITRDLMALIKIPSVSTNKQECERMLLFTKSLYEKNGFSTQMGDEYLLSYYGQGEKEIGLFAHGDVVEAKDDWTLTKNGFEPVIYNGMLVGRGSWDDKSAIVCSLYTLKALRELNFPISKRIACYTGANEENGMSDIINYRKTNTPPDFSLVLDAGFPLYYGDKGKAWVRARAKKPFSQFVNLCGGKMINITLGDCKAQLAYTSELYESIRETDILKKEIKGDEIVIKAQGISAHGASPEGTVNGAYIIAESLKDNPYICKTTEKS